MHSRGRIFLVLDKAVRFVPQVIERPKFPVQTIGSLRYRKYRHTFVIKGRGTAKAKNANPGPPIDPPGQQISRERFTSQ